MIDLQKLIEGGVHKQRRGRKILLKIIDDGARPLESTFLSFADVPRQSWQIPKAGALTTARKRQDVENCLLQMGTTCTEKLTSYPASCSFHTDLF